MEPTILANAATLFASEGREEDIDTVELGAGRAGRAGGAGGVLVGCIGSLRSVGVTPNENGGASGPTTTGGNTCGKSTGLGNTAVEEEEPINGFFATARRFRVG